MSRTAAASYMPRSSGLLGGGGRRHGRPRIGQIKLSNHKRIREEVPDYDPTATYSGRELQLITEKILLADPKPFNVDPMWLPAPAYLSRAKREIYASSGTPEPAIAEGLYWRTHPLGRRFVPRGGGTDESFYR